MTITPPEVLANEEGVITSSVISSIDVQEEFKEYEHSLLKKKYFLVGAGACSFIFLCIGVWFFMPHFLSDEHTDTMTYKKNHENHEIQADILHASPKKEENVIEVRSVYE